MAETLSAWQNKRGLSGVYMANLLGVDEAVYSATRNRQIGKHAAQILHYYELWENAEAENAVLRAEVAELQETLNKIKEVL